MAGIAHLGIGLAAKRAAPQVPVGVLLAASEATDILWGALALTGVETMEYSPWSHSLFTSAVLSGAVGLATARIYRSARSGAAIGLTAFSHWLLDFVTHPMTGGPPDLPLLFDGSPKVGLGLYSRIGLALATPIELGLVALGFALYRSTRKRAAAQIARDRA